MQQSMMLYVHIPFCIQKCAYCDFLSFPTAEKYKQAYIKALCAEIETWKGKESDPVSSVFIGGGTPSILLPDELGEILEALQTSFHIEKNAEQTIEVNPGTVTAEKAYFWRQEGINRISMGVQALDNDLLKTLGRIHTKEQVIESWELLSIAGFQNISFDLMMGLPGQTLSMWDETLHQALALHPRHLSCYSLILEEGTPFFEKQAQLDLPDEETERQMYWHTCRLLSEAGMQQYEISNFSQPSYESRHNTGYWRRKPYIGLGLGASSLLKEQVRIKNTSDMELYIRHSADREAICEERQILTLQDQMEEFMFLGLRCTRGVKKSDFLRLFGCSIDTVYGKNISKYLQYGLLQQEGDIIHLTERGMDVANQVFADFLLN